MSVVRTAAVTLKGNPKDLIGPEIKAGDQAPDFTTVGAGLSIVKLADTSGKVRIFSVVPSLDTPVCNIQTRRFSTELAAFGDKVQAYTVSTDLPFAQARWCGDAKVENMKTLSDLHDQSFGKGFGVLVKDIPVPFLTRAVFIVDANDKVVYAQYVPEIASEPDYDSVLAALKAAVG
ncbi:MAG: thiol peroxidase [Planctomycetota bacterium]|nr:MAG: thiol peroxidase [Planctomycetota bacterium]